MAACSIRMLRNEAQSGWGSEGCTELSHLNVPARMKVSGEDGWGEEILGEAQWGRSCELCCGTGPGKSLFLRVVRAEWGCSTGQVKCEDN